MVFGRGVVEGVDHRADEEEHQPPGRDRDRHQQHAVDQHQIGFGQFEASAQQADDGIDDKG